MAKRIPIAGEGRAWQSTMISIPSPTASRIAATQASAALTGLSPSIGIVGGTAIDLKAVKPSAIAWRARSANCLALSTGVS